MRISTRLILLLVMAVVSVMAVYALVTISRTQALLQEELQKMAEHVGMALSVGALHHLERGDVRGVENVLEAISHRKDVMGAAVFGRDGGLIAVSRSMALEWRGRRQGHATEEGEGYFENVQGQRVYIYASGIRGANGEDIGSLKLALYERSMLPYVLQTRNHILITIAALTGILSALVIYVSQRQIAGPLRALTEGAEAFGQGELGRRIDAGGEGEIAALGAVFNRMAASLEASKREVVAEREHIRNVVDSIPEGIVVLDPDGRITAWNQTMAQRYGLALEAVAGKRLPEVLPCLDDGAFQASADRLLAGEVPRFELREVAVKAAPDRTLVVVGSPLLDPEGRAGGAVLALLDITDRVRLERQVQQSEKLAAVGQLAAGVAHEIGTPLNVISGSAEYLLMGAAKDDPRTEELRAIVSEVGRISDLVKRLMAFARQETPKVEPVAVAGLVESVLALLRGQMEKQGVRVEVALDPGLPDIEGDRDQLQQVLLNLVMNAWQAMPEGGRLKIKTGVRGHGVGGGLPPLPFSDSGRQGWVEVVVEDTGAGIPEAHRQKIFDPFFTTKEAGVGTGLGLAIAHRIVEGHGGQITAISQEGTGSAFTVLLPAQRGDRSHG